MSKPPTATRDALLGLAESELLAIFDVMFADSLEAVLLTRPPGQVLAANPEACRLFGADAATIMALGRAGLTTRPDDPRIAPLERRRAETGAARGQVTMCRANGERFEAELSSSLFRAAGGCVYSTMVVRDLEPGLRAERLVRESDERLHFALEAAQIGDWDRDLHSNVTRRSLWHDRLFGYEEAVAEWSHESFLAHVHPEHRERVDACYRRAMAGEGEYDIEFPALRPDGLQRWLWSKGAFYFDGNGRPYRAAGIQADVTARREAERALEEHEAQLRAIIDSATDALLVADAANALIVFNPAAEELFGCRAEVALGRPLERFIELPSPLDTLRHRSGVALQGWRSDGRPFPAEASFSPGFAGGQPMTTVILRDVSQQEALREARLALEAAEAANRAKTDFLAHMSHELRTPLNAVIGFSDLMLHDSSTPLAEKQRQRVELVRDSGRHLLAMIADLLDVARAEAGHLHVDMQAIELAAPLTEAAAIVRPIAESAHLALRFERDALSALRVHADPLRLRQVVVNLLANAVKYNRPHGGVVLQAAAVGDDAVEISVTDSGIGMNPAQLQRLFRPFERVGSERTRIEGSGLGLSLSRQLVDAMGGQLAVTSEPGVGSRFTVRLQRAA